MKSVWLLINYNRNKMKRLQRPHIPQGMAPREYGYRGEFRIAESADDLHVGFEYHSVILNQYNDKAYGIGFHEVTDEELENSSITEFACEEVTMLDADQEEQEPPPLICRTTRTTTTSSPPTTTTSPPSPSRHGNKRKVLAASSAKKKQRHGTTETNDASMTDKSSSRLPPANNQTSRTQSVMQKHRYMKADIAFPADANDTMCQTMVDLFSRFHGWTAYTSTEKLAQKMLAAYTQIRCELCLQSEPRTPGMLLHVDLEHITQCFSPGD
jgi:hypothetical protein